MSARRTGPAFAGTNARTAATTGRSRRAPVRGGADFRVVSEFARLATLARDWDELMRIIVDRTTEVMGVQVCSFYLMDPPGERLTLTATNGLDRSQVGRVSLAVGQGITGRAAAGRQPVESPDVAVDPRFSWVRGLDLEGLHAMLSVPLAWHERVVGVLNVQTTAIREFSADEVELLTTIAAILAGIVEKGRLQGEIEARLASLTALDSARAELLAVVTHELRTPLSVVRVYLDLLAGAAETEAVADAATVADWRERALEQVTRLDRLVDGILASVRGEGLTGLARVPFDVGGAVSETVDTLAVLLRPHLVRWTAPAEALTGIGDEGRFRQVLEHLLENEAKYAPVETGISVGAWREGAEIRVYLTDDGPGVPREDWETVFEPYVRSSGAGASGRGQGGRGSGIGLFAARRLMDAMGGRVWLEENGYAGSRFVVALPAAM
jgi:signal transduction histidine kinase